jgi:hypothetical protein
MYVRLLHVIRAVCVVVSGGLLWVMAVVMERTVLEGGMG